MPCRPALMQRHHELQGPRPAPLIVANKESHTVMKKRRNQPVIIYVESPKVVHAHPSEFRSVVQRLTGAPSVPATTALPPQLPFQLYGLANEALNKYDMDCREASPFVASTMLPPPVSYLPGDASNSRSLSSFFGTGDQLISPAFLFEDQNMAPAVAGPSSVQQANNLRLGSSAPLLLASLGGASQVNYRFIDHQ